MNDETHHEKTDSESRIAIWRASTAAGMVGNTVLSDLICGLGMVAFIVLALATLEPTVTATITICVHLLGLTALLCSFNVSDVVCVAALEGNPDSDNARLLAFLNTVVVFALIIGIGLHIHVWMSP